METIISVGIDIGTTTTQLVFSKITLENMASFASVPKVKIVNKVIIYESDIYFTPLLSESEIDYEGIVCILEKEYKSANINKKDIATGAVIITGETSRKDNAEVVLKLLSGFAGEFVVAVAGPNLESIMAGKGSGANILSKENNNIVANLDIGGGTTNIAIFQNGDCIDTTCLNIGGRLIKIENNKISYISRKIFCLLEKKGIKISVGDFVNMDILNEITGAMSEILFLALNAKETYELKSLMTVGGLKKDWNIDTVTFSGGVADFIYNATEKKDFFYNDIGIILAKNIKKSIGFKNHNIAKPTETIRATVIGAGVHTVEISGSTIEYNKQLLPLKNIPIVKLSNAEEQFDKIAESISNKIECYRVLNVFSKLAISLSGIKNPTYKQLVELSNQILIGLKEYINNCLPIIIILENDMAKALGQTLKIKSNYKDIICLDGIFVENGDYIDIGMPLSNGKVTPVVIKTIALNI